MFDRKHLNSDLVSSELITAGNAGEEARSDYSLWRLLAANGCIAGLCNVLYLMLYIHSKNYIISLLYALALLLFDSELKERRHNITIHCSFFSVWEC